MIESIKMYFVKQANRRASHLVYDFVVVGGFFACVYYGFIEG